jgi:hypothetical protein
MRELELTVCELLATTQQERKAKLDAGRVDTVFKVGDRVQGAARRCGHGLRPRWDGPFTITACPSPKAYTLALPRRMQGSPTVNVDRLKPFHERVDALPAPGPVSDAGQAGKHEVELPLNRRTTRGVTAISRGGAATRQRSTSGCEWRSWCTARRKWPSTRPVRRPAPSALEPSPLRRPPWTVVPALLLAPRLARGAELRSGTGRLCTLQSSSRQSVIQLSLTV